MLKSALILVLLGALSTNADISRDVDDLRFLKFESAGNYATMEYNNMNSIQSANIQSNLPLVVIIDGFLSNSTSPLTSLLTASYTERGTDNVILLDYSKLSGSEEPIDNKLTMGLLYMSVIGNVDPIGTRLAQFLELIEENEGIPLSEMTIVGGSLGAHIAGATGTYFRKKNGVSKLGRIVGLDPAGQTFSIQFDKDKRLYKGDAQVVEIYHSNRGVLGDFAEDTGDINVYLNGGNNQPGCLQTDLANLGVCSHTYGFKLFNAAFNENIKACPCGGLFRPCTCNTCRYTCANPITLGPAPLGGRGRYYARHGQL